LYDAILDGAIATFIAGSILFSIRKLAPLSHFDRTMLVIVWVLGSYIFAISIPTVLDRSLSLYILEKLQQRGGGIKHEAFEQIFTKEYVIEHRLIDVRLTEQLESGTILIDNDCVKLTAFGGWVATTSRYLRKNFLPKERLLMGTYSDDLTDPFRGSNYNVTYTCQ
jgi:hypothetical protein